MRAKLEYGVDGDDGREGVLVTVPFDEDWKDELKSTLPRAERAWSDRLNGWWVAAEHADYVLELMLRFWPRVFVFGDRDEGDYVMDCTGRTRQESLFG